MANTACKQCGQCCLVDMSVFVTAEDEQRWEQEGRQDILEMIEKEGTIWAGGHDGIASEREGDVGLPLSDAPRRSLCVFDL